MLMSEKITKVKLPEATEIALAAFMARERISSMDKNVVLTRALEVYLDKYAANDGMLGMLIEARTVARRKRGTEAWRKGSHE